MKILQTSLKNEGKTCFPLQPEAHFPKDDISENKEKTKAQLLAVNSNHYKSIYTKAQRFVPLTTLSKINSNHYKSIYIKAQRCVPLNVQERKSASRCSQKHIFGKHAPKSPNNHWPICEQIIKTSIRNHSEIIEIS